MEFVTSMLQPWYTSLETPEETQRKTFETLLKGYRKTGYGKKYNAESIETLEEFRDHFPVATFTDFIPFLDEVKKGNWKALVPEPPIAWAMTRGSTGTAKVIPFTKTDLDQKSICGPRATLNYVYKEKKYDILNGYVLNNNFPSRMGTMKIGDTEVEYGYSSGIYAKYSSERGNLKIVPTIDQINKVGGGVTKEGWKNRFDLAYQEAKDKKVTMVTGVTQVMLQFGQYLKKEYNVYPKDIWENPLLLCISMVGINTKEKPVLKAMYDFLDIREMYGATEGMYAQQLDERPYVFPNYDYYLFEVEINHTIKMLHQLEKGERGSLIISSCLFPRYKIGDIIKSFGRNAFICLGREKDFSIIKYYWDRLMGQTL
ncbi:MAG: GH3 auxin-responsive promoter family protein [Candidatus Methanofastidiosia archaeon]|jgi:phenylacetate-coenzyme A ligase PaaK-like adenylate-forming protein